MKYIKLFILLVFASWMGACSEEALDSKSIFDSTAPERNEFDNWLLKNYVTTYNMSFNYKYDDKESNTEYNLVPADYEKSIALAKLMKHVWLDVYKKVAGDEFLKTFCPRVMQLFGSPAYSTNESIVMGTAEGGIKVTLYNVNVIDIDHPFIDIDSPFPDKSPNTTDLNYWFFQTMHHEFTHILQQKKNYTTDFNLVSAGNYKATDWVNLEDPDAPKLGFVSGYASKEANEDFAEILSLYITRTEAAWQELLAAGIVVTKDSAGNIISTDDSGKQAILKKFAIVKDYLKGSWQIDINVLREAVTTSSAEVATLDLRTLN